MRFAVEALRRPRRRRRPRLRLDGAQHAVRHRPLRALPARPDARLPRRPRLRAGTERRAVAGDPGAVSRPKLAVWKFASCDGCQLTLLDCEDELLALAGEVEIAYFLGGDARDGRRAVRRLARRGLDHHARTTPSASSEVRARLARARHDRRVRDRRRHPGAAQLRRRRRVHLDRLRPAGLHLDARDLDADRRPRAGRLRAARLPDRQAPAARGDQRATCTAARPRVPAHSVCIECKRRGTVCVMVAHGTPCLGPVTHAGCGALCPAYDRGCYGCFGPMETPNTRVAERAAWRELGAGERDLVRVYRTFNAGAEPFREESEAHEHRLAARSTVDVLARVEGEGAMYVAHRRRRRSPTCSCGSTSRRASSRRSCAAARSPRRRTSRRASAASARSPTR